MLSRINEKSTAIRVRSAIGGNIPSQHSKHSNQSRRRFDDNGPGHLASHRLSNYAFLKGDRDLAGLAPTGSSCPHKLFTQGGRVLQ